MVNPISLNSIADFEEEMDRWEKYWTMDSARVCEFTGTMSAEKNAIDEQVAKFFEESIERRKDGYYIRFLFKKNHPPLSSNSAIA
ncbi:hypothetical protein ANCDUO_13216 [Ancylostoma duodenale]|uniref:Uncharacterized protein n=1 Tax=Ancylostoma duodenale TaxID=51022 RepID=A0A0C2GCJ6_9BILA|nr:hypothetical protein ANCDUO_13216 [Ancylostoma duodenale]